jgi:hypothetical protein
MFDTGYEDRVFYRVITAWGNLVAGFPDLPESTGPRIVGSVVMPTRIASCCMAAIKVARMERR